MTSMVMIGKLLIRIVKVVQKSAYGDVNDVNNDGIKVGKSAINKDGVDVDDDGEIGTVLEMRILMEMVMWYMLLQKQVGRYYLLLNISSRQRTVRNGI